MPKSFFCRAGLRMLPGFLSGYRAPAGYPVLAWLSWVAVLLLTAIWAVPNGALPFHRNFILLPGFLILLFLYLFRSHLGSRLLAPLGPRLSWLLLLLSVWMLCTGVWHASSISQFLATYNGKWLRVLETGFMGLLLSRILLPSPAEPGRLRAVDLFWGLICGSWLLAFAQAVDVLLIWRQSHVFPWQFTRLAYSRMELSVSFGFLIGTLCAEIGARLAISRRWLPVSWAGLIVMLLVVLFAQFALATRNATIGVAATVLSVTLLVLIMRARVWRRRTLFVFLCVGLCLLSGIASLSWSSDARWKGFSATVPLALDTQHNLAWLDNQAHHYPLLPDGQQVEVSAYERIAWFKIGSWLVLQEPWGQGLRADNFHQLVARYFGNTTTSQSHSGMINFALANGLPGLLLWLMILAGLIGIGGRSFYREGKIAGLFLMAFVLGFAMRSVFDDIWRDHMLEMFFFFCAVLLSLCAEPREEDGMEISGEGGHGSPPDH
jgi:hypothetical protein